jgi:hypothetical protein
MSSRVREATKFSLFGRLLYWFVQRAVRTRLGKDIDPNRVYSNHPRLLWGYMNLSAAVQGGSLDPRLKTLVFLRASALIGCPF